MIIGNPTGGLIYHWRALKFKKSLWAPFRSSLNVFLSETQQCDSTLLWIGPSAGYNVSDRFLKRYERLIAIEIDPLARALLKKRGLALDIIKHDLFGFAKTHFAPVAFQNILERFPTADILFSNLLGQVALLTPDQTRLDRLKVCLEKRNWITFHDRISAHSNKCRNLVLKGKLSNEELALQYFQPEDSMQVQDHGTDQLDSWHTTYLHWEISPRYHHIVGCSQFLA